MGAKVLLGGADQIRGNFVPPTVLTGVTPEMRIMKEETFGPILPIAKVASAEQAVEQANATRYGLGSAVFGKARARELADKIRAGMTSINSALAYAGVPALPFGGVGDSGFGRIHGDEGLREFSRVKATTEERFPLPVALLSFKLPRGTYDRIKSTIHQLYGGGMVDKLRDKLPF
jgi:acyl-CoA reductase-like NAD-dependent aldehyde dehydrogenase